MRNYFSSVAICFLLLSFYGMVKDWRILIASLVISIILIVKSPRNQAKILAISILVISLVCLGYLIYVFLGLASGGGFQGRDNKTN